jgi:hypothetical protein
MLGAVVAGFFHYMKVGPAGADDDDVVADGTPASKADEKV